MRSDTLEVTGIRHPLPRGGGTSIAGVEKAEGRDMSLRSQLGQLSWFVRSYKPRHWPQQLRAIRNMRLPRLPRSRRQRGQVWGVSVVRDEADVIEQVIRHQLSQGITRLIVADNRSQDGTREILGRLSQEIPTLFVADDREPAHIQSAKMTWLAHQAWRSGADWIVPFDADEFWFAKDMSVADYLRSLGPEAGIVHAGFFHMVPTTAQPADLINSEYVLDSTPSHPGKVAVRAHPIAFIGPGNHYAARVGTVHSGLAIAHAQYRGPQQVIRKVRQGAQASKRTGEDLSWFSPHWVAGASLDDATIEEVWANISAGRPDDRLQYKAIGPMLHLRPLRWRTWDPDDEIA